MTDQVLIWGLLIGFYLATKHFAIDLLQSIWFRVLIIVLVGGHCMIGILEYNELMPFSMGNFPMGNLFGNPGPYAIYLASFVPLLIFFMMERDAQSGKRLAWSLLLIIALITIYLSESRTAMLSIFISAIYWLISIKKSTMTLLHMRIKVAMLVVFTMAVLVCIPIVYRVKKSSADGRLLIWRISSQAVTEAPLLGHGIASFLPVYGNYQSEYFQGGRGTDDEKKLAGINAFAFNEYLQMLIELGVIGVLLFISPILYVLKRKVEYPNNYLWASALKSSIIVIMASSFFSYPLHILSIQVNFFFFLGVLSSITTNKTITVKGHWGYAIILILVFSLVMYFSVQRLVVELKWKKATELTQNGQFHLAEPIYTELLPYKNSDPNFAFNFGAELSIAQQYSRSIPLLEKASEWLSTPEMHNYLGHSYEAHGNLPKAIGNFLQAHYRQPALLYPLYRLVWLYEESGRQSEALQLAKTIVAASPKIVNETTIRIQTEMLDFIQAKNEKTSQ